MVVARRRTNVPIETSQALKGRVCRLPSVYTDVKPGSASRVAPGQSNRNAPERRPRIVPDGGEPESDRAVLRGAAEARLDLDLVRPLDLLLAA